MAASIDGIVYGENKLCKLWEEAKIFSTLPRNTPNRLFE
jgi:hypothetical protein